MYRQSVQRRSESITKDVPFPPYLILAKQMSRVEVKRREESVWVEVDRGGFMAVGLKHSLKDG